MKIIKMLKDLHITLKLTLVFILFATLLLLGLSVPAYLNARSSLRAAAISELLVTSLEKEAALKAWVDNREHLVEDISSLPSLQESLQKYMDLPAGSLEAQWAYKGIVLDLKNFAGPGHKFISLQIIEANNGRVLISTKPGDEGKFREQETYFTKGLIGPRVENPFYDLSSTSNVMMASGPLFTPDGDLIGVLAGSLDLTEMYAIIQRRTGLHRLDDAFLVNTSHLFVTQPRLLVNSSVLQRGIHTIAVNACLAHNSGVYEGNDYRNVPTIMVYRWIIERNMCLIVKIDQQEAYTAARALNLTFLLVGGLVLLAGSLVSVAIARSVARPLHELLGGTIQLGQGDLQQRIQVRSSDEIGKLGQAFNQMAGSLQAKDILLRGWADELEQKVEQRTLELSDSEERYRILAETSPDMIFVIDKEDQVQYVNDLGARQFGKTPEQVIGKPRTELFPPAIAESQGHALQQVLRTGETLSSESPITFPGGQRWLDTQLVPLRNKAGQVNAVMGVSRDVTARKQADLIILEEKAFSESIINSLPGIFYLFNAQGKFLRWNKNFEILSGYSAEEMLERNPADFFVGDEKVLLQERIQQVFISGQADVEANFTSRHGVATPHYLTGVRIQLNGQPHLVGVGVDITKRKLAEAELHLKNIVFNASISANSIADVDGIITNINPAFMKLWGYENEAAAIGNPVASFFVNESDAIPVMEALTNTGQWEGEFLAKRVDGSRFISKGLASTIYNVKGEHIGYQSANLDVSNEKQAEELLRKSLEDLSRSNSELERFAYVASHDLQEPLRMVTSYLQLLERRYKDKLDEDAIEFINYAVDGSSRMKVLISDLLAYSRVGTRGKEFKRVDCGEVLGNVLQNLQVSLVESQAKLTYDPLPVVMGDDSQLESLFQNLIANAIKFHGKKKPKIHVGVKKEATNWVFSVSDNGIGIDPQYFERIFIIFQRLHKRQNYAGTGIGLAISKRIVERHGGRIWIESEPGQGSTFFFSLPFAAEK